MASRNVDRIFESFVDVNGFDFRADFAQGTTVYTGLGYERVTQERLQQTPAFAGFVDGWSGRPDKYKGVLGTPERDRETGFGIEFVGHDVSAPGFLGDGPDPLSGEEVVDRMRRAIDVYAKAFGEMPEMKTPQQQYSEQYELGRTSNALNE